MTDEQELQELFELHKQFIAASIQYVSVLTDTQSAAPGHRGRPSAEQLRDWQDKLSHEEKRRALYQGALQKYTEALQRYQRAGD